MLWRAACKVEHPGRCGDRRTSLCITWRAIRWAFLPSPPISFRNSTFVSTSCHWIWKSFI